MIEALASMRRPILLPSASAMHRYGLYASQISEIRSEMP